MSSPRPVAKAATPARKPPVPVMSPVPSAPAQNSKGKIMILDFSISISMWELFLFDYLF